MLKIRIKSLLYPSFYKFRVFCNIVLYSTLDSLLG